MHSIFRLLGSLILTTVVTSMAQTSDAAEKKVYADYFVAFKSRLLSNDSGIWRYYQGDKVAWPGDLYTEPGSTRKLTSTPYYPLIGTYDALDPVVLEYHILLAKLAGIDGFLCEFGIAGGHDSQVAVRMAELGKKYRFEVGIHWVPFNFTSWSNTATREAMLAAAKKTLTFVLEKIYAISGVHVDGRPLILIFNARAVQYLPDQVKGTPFTGGELRALRESQPGPAPMFLAWNLKNDPLDEFVDGYYPWVVPSGSTVPPGSRYDSVGDLELQKKRLQDFYQASAEGVAAGRFSRYMAGVWPGFDDSRGRAWGEDLARYVPREDGRTLKELWDLAKASGAAHILIATWNDWVESTNIEPSVEWGFSDLETCQAEIATWKGGRPDPVSLRLPLRLYHLRRTLEELQQAGISAKKIAGLAGQADEAGVHLSRIQTTEAEGMILDLERACEKLAAKTKRELVAFSDSPASANRTQKPDQVKIRFPAEWRKKLSGQFVQGRLNLTYQDDAAVWITVRQSSTSGQRELAKFLSSGRKGWRAAELDILPSTRLGETEFIIAMESAGERVGNVTFTLDLLSVSGK